MVIEEYSCQTSALCVVENCVGREGMSLFRYILIYPFSKQIDGSLYVSRWEKLVIVSEQGKLRQLASSHCSKPLATPAFSNYNIVKVTVLECLECLVSSFILAAQINTLKQNALAGRKDIHHTLHP